MHLQRAAIVLAAGSAVAISLALPRLTAQETKPAQGGPPRGAPSSGGDELIEALKASPGCLGVEVAFTQTRKAVIFSWFKDKDAVLDWYESDYHQTAMMGLQEAAAEAEKQGELPYAPADGKAAESDEPHGPLAHVADDVGPILCIATITPSQKQLVPGFDQSISQISIELYAPLPGGIAFNGKFAPAALKVPHLLEMSAPQEPKSAEPASRASH